MSVHHPDRWLLIKKGDDVHVLGTWSGSYTFGASWRINSGITEVREERTTFYIYGETGSVYTCGKQSYGVAGISNQAIVDRVKYEKWFILDYEEAVAWIKEKMNASVSVPREG